MKYLFLLLPLLVLSSCKEKAIFYGDSITNGFNLPDSGTVRWTNIVCKRLGIEEDNRAVSSSCVIDGADSAIAVKSLDELTEFSLPAYRRYYKYVFIAYGTNDIGMNSKYYTPELFENRFNAIIRRFIFKGWPRNKIIIVSPFYTSQTGRDRYVSMSGVTKAADEERLLLFYDIVKSIANRYHCQFIDVYHDFKGNDSLLIDGIHRTVKGQSLIANTVLNSLN